MYGKNEKYTTELSSPSKKSLSVISGITEKNGINYYTDDKLAKNEIFEKELTISTRGEYSGTVFYHPEKFTLANNILVMSMPKLTKRHKQFIGSLINSLPYGGYDGYPRKETLKNDLLYLPTKNGEIDYEFMESFIKELENEQLSKLEAYLSATGLKDYKLTPKEQKSLNEYEQRRLDESLWAEHNLEDLYGKSTRGRRLKSDDRIPGELPFVTAGESNEGVSAFIGNNVTTFSENTTTIDMFGSAKYRNYKYGGDDHIAVVHTQHLDKLASIFVTSAIHKSSHTGEFHYGRNFYARDADALNISLPTKDGKVNYESMSTLISAIQKLVIKDVVLYTKEKSTSAI